MWRKAFAKMTNIVTKMKFNKKLCITGAVEQNTRKIIAKRKTLYNSSRKLKLHPNTYAEADGWVGVWGVVSFKGIEKLLMYI